MREARLPDGRFAGPGEGFQDRRLIERVQQTGATLGLAPSFSARRLASGPRS